MPARPTISLCVIAKDEEHGLADCLGCVADLVDEMIVVDTGSTDRTKEVAAEQGARVFDFAWVDDFSAARNETLRHATGDWIFWLDADDRVDAANHERLRAVLEGLKDDRTIYAMQCLSRVNPEVGSDCVVSHMRLFPRIPELTWGRRVHESILSEELPPGVEIRFTDVVIEHFGYQDSAARRRKLHRDLRLLQLDYALNPDDPLTLFYLGWTHLELGQSTHALRFLRRSAQRSPRIRKLHALLVDCLSGLGRRGEAMEAVRHGLALYPNDTELLYRHARLTAESGDLAGGEQGFLALLSGPSDAYLQVGVETGLRGPKARYMLGLIYSEQGRLGEAESQFRRAVLAQPDYSRAWIGLGQIYLGQRRFEALEGVLQALAECPQGEVYSPVLRARALIEREQFAAARRLLDRAIVLAPNMLWPRLVLSDLLFREGRDWEAAVKVEREILAMSPQNEVARERLAYLLRQAQPQPVEARLPQEEEVPEMGCSVVVIGP